MQIFGLGKIIENNRSINFVAQWKECPAGYYCPGDNTQLDCGCGNYCPAGSSKPTPCGEKQYSTSKNASQCETAQIGYYANSSCNQTACTKMTHRASWTSNSSSDNCNFTCANGYSPSRRQCNPNTYTLTYNLDGGSPSIPRQSFIFNSQDPISSVTPTKANNVFLYRDYNGKHLNPGEKIPTGQGSFTLKAIRSECTSCSPKNAYCTLSIKDNKCTYSTSCKDGYENLQNAGTYHPSCTPKSCPQQGACGRAAHGSKCTTYNRCSSTPIRSTCSLGQWTTTPGSYSSPNQLCKSCPAKTISYYTNSCQTTSSSVTLTESSHGTTFYLCSLLGKGNSTVYFRCEDGTWRSDAGNLNSTLPVGAYASCQGVTVGPCGSENNGSNQGGGSYDEGCSVKCSTEGRGNQITTYTGACGSIVNINNICGGTCQCNSIPGDVTAIRLSKNNNPLICGCYQAGNHH